MLLGEGRPQPVVDHRVNHLAVAHARAEACLGEQVRRLGHGFHTARDDDFDLAGADQLVGKRDRVDAGETNLVNRDRRHLLGDSGLDRGLPGGDLAGAGLQDVAHDHVVDVLALHSREIESGPDRVRPETLSRDLLERAPKLAKRRARARYYHGGHRAGGHIWPV